VANSVQKGLSLPKYFDGLALSVNIDEAAAGTFEKGHVQPIDQRQQCCILNGRHAASHV
jgi:hypothetical protein